MIITQPTLHHIQTMHQILRPEVERGVILDRSIEVMANMVRSYHIAFEELEILESSKTKSQQLVLEDKPLNALKEPVLLGFCALHIHSTALAEIRSLIVIPKAQRLGIATALIKDCEREGQILGIKEILVLTYKRALFEKLEFVEVSKEKIPNQKIWADCILCKHFPQCDEIALIKKI